MVTTGLPGLKKLPSIYLNVCTLYIIMTKNFYSNTGLYQVRLNNDEIAEIYFSGMWIPICGHYFWNNNIGATLFCQQLGYQMGEIKQESISRQVPLPNDGFRIGSCNENDIWPQCTGKSLSEALILESTNPQYDKSLFIDLPVQKMKTTSSENFA